MNIKTALRIICRLSTNASAEFNKFAPKQINHSIHTIEGLCRGILTNTGYDRCPRYRPNAHSTAGCDICNQLVR